MIFTFYSHNGGKIFSANEIHLQDPIIKSFLEIPGNTELFNEAIQHPTKMVKQQLDDSFKEFFFQIRFTSYLSSAIHFNAINYDKKLKLFLERNQLTLDLPTKGYERTSFSPGLSPQHRDYQELSIDSSNIEDHLTSDFLFKAIQQLTTNQRQIVSLAYIFGLNDTEIASYLNKSQQAVSKSHKKALNKLRESIEKMEKEGL